MEAHAEGSAKRGPPRRSCKEAPTSKKCQRTEKITQVSCLVVRISKQLSCAVQSLHGWSSSVEPSAAVAMCSNMHGVMQPFKPPWSPFSAVRRCLAAAERNARSTTVVRPELHDMVSKILPSIRETVVNGTNSSFALVGPHGCGKSLV
jgi:hypothetical protein